MLNRSFTNTCHGCVMSSPAPISYHLDLFRYWQAKRAGRAMPARSDLNPGEIRALLPYLTIIDKLDGQFHYRLIGTAVNEELGRDLTGGFVGSYVSPPEYAAALQAIYDRIFATAHPIFTTGEYKAKSGAIHGVSRLLLPLSDDGVNVNMVVFTRIARFNRNVTAGADWLRGAPGKVCEVIDVDTAADIEARALDWETHCLTSNAAA